jgi:hypothetical protein
LAAKLTFGSWYAGTRGNIPGPRFLAQKSVFGRILPIIKVGTIPVKVDLWHNHAIFLILACAMITHVAEWT